MPKQINFPQIRSEDEFWHCIGILLGDILIQEKDIAHKLAVLEASARALLPYYRYLQERDLGIHTSPRKFSFHNK